MMDGLPKARMGQDPARETRRKIGDLLANRGTSQNAGTSGLVLGRLYVPWAHKFGWFPFTFFLKRTEE
jgi:hypothetical protein